MQVQINKQLILESIGKKALIGGAVVGGIAALNKASDALGIESEKDPAELNNHIRELNAIDAGHEHMQAASFGDH